MGVGLQPLEFTECLADSPHFRENLQRHEKELERTSQQIKRLIKEVKDVVQAAKRLGAAQLALAASMEQFEFACIGASMTDDERVIGRSLHHFAQLIRTIEDERDRMLGRAHEQIIQPLERFRKEHIGAVKEGKKKFDKKTAKFCQSQERTLSLSTKKPETVFQEADAAMDMAERDFCQASLEYVFQLQAVQERKKFELVETLLGFVFGWWTFHHTAHDVHADSEPLVRDLQLRIQRTRSNFEETSKQTESLMKKMMEMRQMSKEDSSDDGGGSAGGAAGAGGVARAGYLFLMEKKAFGTAWSKHYCTYEQSSQLLALMPYNQINVKTVGAADSVCVSGAREASDAERRFCWEALAGERPPLLLQSLGERDRAAWLRRRRLRAPPHRRHRGAGPRGAGPVQGGGRGVEGVAAGGAGARGAGGRRGAGGPAGVGHAHADVRAQGVPARAARAAAHAPLARPVSRRRKVRAAGGTRVRAARAGARAAARQPRAAARRAHPPAQRGRPQRPQPDDGLQPGGVLRADADARRARDRRLHPGAEVLQRAGGGAAGQPAGGVRARAAAAAAAARAARRAARAPPPARTQRPRGSRARARARRRHGPRRHRVRRVRAAAPAAAAAVQRARPLQLQLRVRLQPQRLAAAPRPARRAPPAGAHPVRVPRRERGGAVVRAEPDHHGRDAVAGAGLAARHAPRPQRPRARELRGAAAVAPAARRAPRSAPS